MEKVTYNQVVGKPHTNDSTPAVGTTIGHQLDLLRGGYEPIPIEGKRPKWKGWARKESLISLTLEIFVPNRETLPIENINFKVL